jgi:hypothetical protein
MRKLAIVALIIFNASLCLAKSDVVRPFQVGSKYTPKNDIDKHVSNLLQKHNLKPANLCSDEVFIRRAYLDITGSIPKTNNVKSFLNNTSKTKREKLIDDLLSSPEFADYYSMKWCDLLRVKAEFPINLWPNAVQAYHRWIKNALTENMPYDQFARQMLTSSGSNFRVPQVNFYRALQGKDTSSIASAVALTFMGTRVDNWHEKKRKDLDAFFSRVAYKGTAEWKEEIVYLDPSSTETIKTRFPDGTSVTIPLSKDPRYIFADWLIESENQYFAKTIVNRIWAWLFGYGIIHQPDDIRPDNPPSNPELLAFLEKELVRSKYDLKHIYRLILNSRTYQQSSIKLINHPDSERFFTCYPVRQIEAEVLADALYTITGIGEKYESAIPEPFSFIPETNRSIALVDGSITSQFLEMFGRPSRDTGTMSERNNNPTDAQRMHLLNSTHIQTKIQNSPKLRSYVAKNKRNRPLLIRIIYMTVLSRMPTRKEMETIDKYYTKKGMNTNFATSDLIWALVNSKEFLYRH